MGHALLGEGGEAVRRLSPYDLPLPPAHSNNSTATHSISTYTIHSNNSNPFSSTSITVRRRSNTSSTGHRSTCNTDRRLSSISSSSTDRLRTLPRHDPVPRPPRGRGLRGPLIEDTAG